MWFNMFRASPRPSSGAYNCTGSLWFYRSQAATGALLVVVFRPLRTTLQPLPANGRKKGSQCTCLLLMMGGETPETC